MVPGELIGRRQALLVLVRRGCGVEDDLAAGAAGESEEVIEPMPFHHDYADALPLAKKFLVALEIKLRHGRGDRRDQLGQDAVLASERIAIARCIHETVEADD